MAKCCNCCPILKGRNSKKIVLLLVGLDNAGKTTAARNLVGGTTEDVIPTVGFSSIKLKHRGMDVRIYDLGGGSQIRAIWKSYFSDVHGVIFVLDASDASRLEECKLVLENLLRNEKLSGKPVLVLANKQDKPGALDQVDIVEGLRLEPLVNEQKCLTLIEECSAINSQRNRIDPRILNGYRWLVNQIANDYDKLNSRVEHDRKIEAELFEARRNELRQRLEANKEDRSEIPYLNGGSENLPYKNNIIHVSPPPGVVLNPSSSEEIVKYTAEESPVANLTKHIREQLERQSIKERHRMSLTKKNKILPAFDGDIRVSSDGRRPKSEPYKLGVSSTLLLPDIVDTPALMGSGDDRQDFSSLRTVLTVRPSSSKSLGHEGRAWDLEKELEVVVPSSFRKSTETSEVRCFDDIHPI